jgi:CRISPR/Cas system-associated protein Csx1
MPTHICNKCKAALLSCKLFLNQSKKTENILKQIYQCKDRPSASQLFIKLQIENEEIEMINQQLKDVETLQSKEKVKVSTECSMDTLIKKEGTTDDESLCEEVKILVEPMPIIKLRKRKGMVFMFFPKR